MLPLCARVDLGAITMKRNTLFLKASALQESHHQIVLHHIQDTLWGILTLSRDAAGVFHNPSRLGPSLGESSLCRGAAGVVYSCSRLGWDAISCHTKDTPLLLRCLRILSPDNRAFDGMKRNHIDRCNFMQYFHILLLTVINALLVKDKQHILSDRNIINHALKRSNT